MKKLTLTIAVFLFVCLTTVYSQLTSNSPDQGTNSGVKQLTNSTPVSSQSSSASSMNSASSMTSTASSQSFSSAISQSNAAASPETEILVTNGVLYNDGKYYYAGTGTRFILSAKDELSGIKKINIKLDDSDYGVYTLPFGFITEGKHTILFNAVNNVDTVCESRLLEFIVDLTPPEVSLASDKKPAKVGDDIYIGTNYNFSVRAYDTLSGVSNVFYMMDDSQTNSILTNTFQVAGSNGVHKIAYFAMDNVGNVSEIKNYSFILDTIPPTVSISANPLFFTNNGTNYISGSALIKISAQDDESGIAVIQYSLDGGDYTAYLSPFKLSGGAHEIKARAIDNVGNISSPVDLQVTVDNSIPETTITSEK